ncbi:MAG: hypothetical protein K5640_05940 [Treponema sp.]|nr:hypothetical protein [Treponema sp.]
MASNDISIKGRKVFFLNLSVDVKERLSEALRKEEYEVYILDDYRYAKTILRQFPESILFLQIDEHDMNRLTTNQWFNFLNSFSEDDNLCEVLLGVMSKRMSTSMQNYFMSNLPLAAGIIAIRNLDQGILAQMRKILDLNNAKGRRQYVRARCPDNSYDYLKCSINGFDYSLKLNDLSCAGISCYLPVGATPNFQQNAVLNNMTLMVGINTKIVCSAAIFAVKPLNEKTSLLILLLLPSTTTNAKNLIREHVFEILQGEIDSIAFGKPMEETEYPDEIVSTKKHNFLTDEHVAPGSV